MAGSAIARAAHDPVAADWLRRYHEAAFRFLKLSSGTKVVADFDRVFSNRDVSVIAPTHGNAIRPVLAGAGAEVERGQAWQWVCERVRLGVHGRTCVCVGVEVCKRVSV